MQYNEYIGSEIISKLKLNKKNKIIVTQKIDVKCAGCGNVKNIRYEGHRRNRIKSKDKIYLCHKCKVRKNITEYNNTHTQSITFIEKYGLLKAEQIKNKISFASSKRMEDPIQKFRLGNQMKGIESPRKNKSYEMFYGDVRAKKIKASMGRKGILNAQYGKPAYNGSGNGWSGWYKSWYFRSLMELSFMVNYIEKNKLLWENAEVEEYAIPYVYYNGLLRHYFADFIINKNQLIEVKPFKLINTPLVKIKANAALTWCKNKNMIYTIMSYKDFEPLSRLQIKNLVDNGILKWLPRYEEKYKKEYNK